MFSPDVAENGSFTIDAADGATIVELGFAVFDLNGQVYACHPKGMPAKLAAAAGPDNAVVDDLTKSIEARRERKAEEFQVSRAAKRETDKPLRIKPMIGSPPAPQFAQIDQLKVDDSYQRSIEGGASKKLIRTIAENWDWRLCLPLIVSRRNGELYVIDGQHRKEGAALRGDIRDLPVVVFDFDDPQQEAELFVQANRSRRAMSTLDDFHAAVAAGDAKAIAINSVVTEAGLVVGRNQAWQYWQPGEVIFTQAIKKALVSQGKEIATRALTMIAQAFDGMVLVGGGAIFTGLCIFIQSREKDERPIDADLMTSVLSEVGIPGWKEATEGVESGQDRIDSMLKAMEEAYAEAEAE
ncbi:hypothetical protein BWQ93_05820 [Sphingopyxis sp. QXT-31]|nr:hypothetical protein BWQ93_05820 [Sphingopyxis sp. QXT-31]